MTNVEVIKALRCDGHNMIFHYCDKEDCPYCQYSYYENLHRCNVQELGINAANALEAAERRIARLEEDLKIREAEREVMKDTIKICEEAADRYKEQLPKEGEWKCSYPEIVPNPMFIYGICSICGFEQTISNKLNYCPNCGARMKFNGKQKTKSKNTKSSLEYDYCGTPKRRYDIKARMKGEQE